MDLTVEHKKTIAGYPSVLATGDGRVWTSMTGLGRVYGIDPASLHVVTKSDSGVQASGVGILFGEGAVWVSNGGGGEVARVDPTTGAVKTIVLGFDVTIGGETGIRAVSYPLRFADGFNSIWVSDNTNGVVYRIDPATFTFTTIQLGAPLAGISGSGIAEADGSIWVTSPGSKEVVRIDPLTNTVQDRIQLPFAPNGLTVGDGSVWVTVNPHSA